jgi:hypothetical protein
MKIAINILVLIILEKHSLNTVFPINWKNMVNVISKRCIHENCNKRPTLIILQNNCGILFFP